MQESIYTPMSETTVPAVAPSLSTYQDQDAFEFQRYEKAENERAYLGEWSASNLEDKLKDYYSLDALVNYLSQLDPHGNKKFKKITLQFPDALVADSAVVVKLIQGALNVSRSEPKEDREEKDPQNDHERNHHHHKEGKEDCKKTCANCKCSDPLDTKASDNKQHVWILADTAYSACCIDEVAAEHVQSDVVVHFGDACMNAIQKLPAVYVFGKPVLDIATVVKRFEETYTEKDQKVVLMADAPYTRHLPEIYNTLKSDYPNIAFADINLSRAHDASIIGFESSTLPSNSTIRFSNRLLISNEAITNEDELLEYDLFYLTEPQAPHLLYLTTKFASISLVDPLTSRLNQGPFPSLMKRYRYMHVSRTAGTIGILVNTLSLRNTTELIRSVKAKIKDAGKKSYMFVVGKPNVAKLANFESIEVWCVLGCGQGGIVLDQDNEFYKPIITPYELELALDPMVSWTGKWVTEFENFLSDDSGCNTILTEDEGLDEVLDGEDQAPEFNPVTGKYVSTSRPLRAVEHLEIDSVAHTSTEEGQLVKAFSQTVAIKGTVSTSAIHLQNREWTGLGSDFHLDEDVDEEGALVEEGKGGVARGYGFDIIDAKGK